MLAPLEAIKLDVQYSEAGELLAVMLIANLVCIEGDSDTYNRLVLSYLHRIISEELYSLYKRLNMLYRRLRIAPHMPILLRARKLARMYPWLRPLLNSTVSSGESHSRLRRLALEAAKDLYEPSREYGYRLVAPLEPKLSEYRPKQASLKGYLEALNLYIDASRIIEGLTIKLHPVLRDPWLLARLDNARIATRLLSFEKQLYNLTGVEQALSKAKSTRILHATKILRGFKPAIVKHYTSPIAAKWVLASLLTLHLPRPRVKPLSRLIAEYEYSMRLRSLGFNTPEPILIDHRRLKAAYTYIEGVDLIDLIKKNPAPPQYRLMGRMIAEIHRKGIALWDSNPSNFIYSRDKGELYVIDLEQARDAKSIEDKAWDLAVACYYSGIYAPYNLHTRVALIVEGYLEAGGEKEVVLEASRVKYMAPFLTAIAPNVLEKAKRTMRRLAS